MYSNGLPRRGDMEGGRGFDESWADAVGFDVGCSAALVRRATRADQMDFTAALDEMVSLCLDQPSPQRAAYYRRQTKGSWARDDPGFALLLAGFMVAAAVAFGAALGARSLGTYCYLVALALLYYALCGVAAATGLSAVLNVLIRDDASVERVEWLPASGVGAPPRRAARGAPARYAFDVHTNAFFVSFMVAFVAHYALLPVVLHHSFASLALANFLQLFAFACYAAVLYRGFRPLALRNTEALLWPILAAAGAYAGTLLLAAVLGIRFNASRVLVAVVL
mmetsp:Transcript_18945/g.56270  ORF Transcript_18945/g.56270 Transcript_18945/m.56270 type:complete len:280 (+) Transcript_18945:287-1126(+)